MEGPWKVFRLGLLAAVNLLPFCGVWLCETPRSLLGRDVKMRTHACAHLVRRGDGEDAGHVRGRERGLRGDDQSHRARHGGGSNGV